MGYIASKASGLSRTQMRKQYSFQNMRERSSHVEDAIMHAKHIREFTDDLAKSKNSSVLRVLDVSQLSDINESTDDCIDQLDLDVESESNECKQQCVGSSVDNDWNNLVDLIRKSSFNYFEVVDHCSISFPELIHIISPEPSREKLERLEISYQAYCCEQKLNDELNQREVDAVNGEIVTDSESDNADQIFRVRY